MEETPKKSKKPKNTINSNGMLSTPINKEESTARKFIYNKNPTINVKTPNSPKANMLKNTTKSSIKTTESSVKRTTEFSVNRTTKAFVKKPKKTLLKNYKSPTKLELNDWNNLLTELKEGKSK